MGNLQKRLPVRIISSDKTWIESEALEQLKKTSELDSMQYVVGLPDLHPGKGTPVGAAFVSTNKIYPHLVGNDIGCGMGLFETSLSSVKMKVSKWVSNLKGLDDLYEQDVNPYLNQFNVTSTPYDASLGTIGGGNHFAELQKIEKICDEDLFESLKLDHKKLYLTVHSGSRGYGQHILENHIKDHGTAGISITDDYLGKHDNALHFAAANRFLIAERFLNSVRSSSHCILDIFHNFVENYQENGESVYIHRKGATPSDKGPVIIPGSRGSFTYLVQPIGDQKNNAFSLAHGAGRKWKRSDAKGKLSNYRKEDFVKTALGSFVICEDKDLIFEEAPQAYKHIESVIDDLISHGLIKIIAILRPVITYKTQGKCS